MQENFAEDQMFTRRDKSEQKASFQIGDTEMNQLNENMAETLGNVVNGSSIPTPDTNVPTHAKNNEEKRKRLSKGAMKRFKVFLANGLSEEDARKQALIIPPPPEPKKKLPVVVPPKRLDMRPRMDNRRRPDGRVAGHNRNVQWPLKSLMSSTPIYQPPSNYTGPRTFYGDQPIVFRRHFNETSIKQDAKQIRVGILPINYPVDLLSTEKMKMIEEQILKKILQQKHSLVKPSFMSTIHKIGYIILICKDNMTVQWLMNLFNWNIENLQVVDSTSTALTNVLEALFPFSAEMSTATIFDMVAAQNNGVYPDKWKVISEIVAGSALQLIIAMDNASLNTLEREKFKLYYRFNVIKFDHCLGSVQDMIISHKKMAQTNDGLTEFQGRGSYNAVGMDHNRDNVYSSDILYNRY